MTSSCAGGGSGWVLGKFLYGKGDHTLAQDAQGNGGVTTPEVFKNHVDMALGQLVPWVSGEHGRAALVIESGDLEGFTNLRDSVIP